MCSDHRLEADATWHWLPANDPKHFNMTSPDPMFPDRDIFQNFSRQKKYLVGVSGGLDSMVLLQSLHNAGFRKLVICHFDHGLRPAEKEQTLIEAAAKRLGLPIEFGLAQTRLHAKTEGLSLEAAARDLRYRFFEACAKQHRCPRIFLAHHADDQVETILLNIFRGSGISGLAGMRGESTLGQLTVLRPLLTLTRDQLTVLAKNQKIRFVEDPTNSSPAHTRNRIRHQLIPVIRKVVGPSYRQALLRLAEIASLEDDFVISQVPEITETLSTSALRSLPPALRRRFVMSWLRFHGVHEPGLSEVKLVLSLLDGPTAKINLPQNLHARRRAGIIFLER